MVLIDLCIQSCLSFFTPEEVVNYLINHLDKKNAELLLSRFKIQIQSGIGNYDLLPITFNKKGTLQLFYKRLEKYPKNTPEYILFKDFLEQ